MRITIVGQTGSAPPTNVAGAAIKVAAPVPLPTRGSPIVYRYLLAGRRGATALHPLEPTLLEQDIARMTSGGSRRARGVIRADDFSEETLELIVVALRTTAVVHLELIVD